ncbi:hypothetical protein CEUSTIGMA_g11376.t1 [Chlamydomonas eustigma]|uniref:Uncharacterized protein n=1 Tax=Chlamydomonas eustigma TaxID=1157962 RepID=A0A250XM32_9CHLO|nr:hypothetical protein CEUSTIGMA_g11376.t1 [Chlamydomonas eustigma]|eukprot:GAX83952.1 hypothetical protein CEUSTIGMA_g11376.t1 [Chlamydomonas eustigma]
MEVVIRRRAVVKVMITWVAVERDILGMVGMCEVEGLGGMEKVAMDWAVEEEMVVVVGIKEDLEISFLKSHIKDVTIEKALVGYGDAIDTKLLLKVLLLQAVVVEVIAVAE